MPDISGQVAHVTFSPLGGAGAVAVRLAEGQRRLGWKTNLITRVQTPFPRWAGRHPFIASAALIDYGIVRKQAQSSFFSLFRRQHSSPMAKVLVHTPGILHLHWLPGFLWPPTLLAKRAQTHKTVWSVQDLWPFTGGCHYANECTGFTQSCEACPQVHRWFQPRVAEALKRKQEGLAAHRNLRVVTPSEWARSHVQSSGAMGHLPTAVIPNPVDTRLFSPRDTAAVRRKWALESKAFIIGIGAADLRDERKQIKLTLNILHPWLSQRHDSKSVQVLVFGAGGPIPGLPSAFRFMGPSRTSDMLAEWYNAMDVYVSLSRYETFGNTLAEAAACAVPSICLTGSGMAEVVVPDKTGRHVSAPEALPAALSDWIEQPEQARHMGIAAREHALSRFSDAVVARQFIDVYQETI